MGYWEELQGVAGAHLEEIKRDLEEARQALSLVHRDASALEHRVSGCELLLLAADEYPLTPSTPHSELTLHAAMAQVLEHSPGKRRRAADLAAEINRQGLYRMRDGRPVEPQQVHARVGHYSHLFAREDTFIRLLGEPT